MIGPDTNVGAVLEELAADPPSPEGITAVTAPTRPVGTLIDSAGFGLPLTVETDDVEDEVRHLRLHDEVPMRLMHAVLPSMLARLSGTILTIASASAVMPRSTYAACKARLVMFSYWVNSQYGNRGVTATAVRPGCTTSTDSECLRAAHPAARHPHLMVY